MPKIITVQTSSAPAAIGPYAQAVTCNDFIFCSGQIGLDPKTNVVVEGVEKQTHQVLQNLTEVLKSAGSDLNCVVKTTIYIKNISDFTKVNEIYGSYFNTHKPARATIEAARLPKDALIEIDAIAVKKSE